MRVATISISASPRQGCRRWHLTPLPRRFPAPTIDPSLIRFAEGMRIDGGAPFSIALDSSADDPTSAEICRGTIPDRHMSLIELVKSVVPPGARILDLGGHLGTFSLAAAALGFRVLAVEASPRNASLLRASIDRNQFTNMTLIHAVVSDRPGTLEVRLIGPDGQIVSPGTRFASVSVPAIAIDSLLEELGWTSLDFIKMDIAGSEVAGLHGMKRTLSRADAPPLFVESNGHALASFHKTPDDLKRSLESFGYRNYLVEKSRLAPVRVDDLQPTTATDYLALKKIPASLKSWRSDRALTTDDLVKKVLASAVSSNADDRRYIARSLRTAPTASLEHSTVRHIIEGLKRDADDSVRKIASDVATGSTKSGQRAWIRRLFG